MLSSGLKNCLLYCLILSIVLLVNLPVIHFNMMYPEQPTIYLANQTITHLSDLLRLYLHPQWLHPNVGFFRPSGHFLIYQILAPFLGWQNTQAFLVVSFMFLAGIGFFLLKLYRLLFPGYQWGAYIAFSLYLMHPSLSLARLTLMHFEFSYVFFIMVSLYCLALFCEKNNGAATTFRHLSLFLFSLFFYALACTFKEPALMLGPVMIGYLWLNRQRHPRLIGSIMLLSIGLGFYITAAWPSLTHTPRPINLYNALGTINAFLKDIFGLTHTLIPQGGLPFPHSGWSAIQFPLLSKVIMLSGGLITLLSTSLILFQRHPPNRRPLLFLYVAAISFEIIPILWGIGAPWHHSLTLLFLCIIMGFSAEQLLRMAQGYHWLIPSTCIGTALAIAMTTLPMNQQNIQKYVSQEDGFLGMALNRNAVQHPPDIKQKLNSDSLIVVEDSRLHNDYFLGNSAYPLLLFLDKADYLTFKKRQQHYMMRFDLTYSGTLFRYAYNMPSLHEEVYPFNLEAMNEIPNEIIYNWLKHANNIFCLGYDEKGNWHDKTMAFKQQLSNLQAKRHLTVKNYRPAGRHAQASHLLFSSTLNVPDQQLCEFTCDQSAACQRFIYKNFSCQFYGR
ncbi:MAG: hypothetical protein A3E85_02850 [Gammaproteobacteria bacterium RIFCSPHIGHO2_12_FULL_45_12]|nr:MAG: hypothetical protein A3E85_02850 [Gammaproteobacteria bacterium RIFCSPHIGHO2_12_FULL_45_12]